LVLFSAAPTCFWFVFCQALLLLPYIIMFQRRSNCLWLLVILVIPSFSLTLSVPKKSSLNHHQKVSVQQLSLSIYLSLSLSASVQLSTPKSKETQKWNLVSQNRVIPNVTLFSPCLCLWACCCFHPISPLFSGICKVSEIQ
jgi:hypothetical protein